MWYLLKLLFIGPSSQTVEIPLRRRMNALEADVEQLQTDRDSKRGQILTLQRRISRVEREVWDEELEDEDDELHDMISQRREARG